MTDAIFPLEEVLSPRLKWQTTHGITMIDLGEKHTSSHRFVACRANEHFLNRYGYGNTEHDACLDLAAKAGLKTWHEA